MFKIDDTTIRITRGDIATIEVSANGEGNTAYEFKVGDVVRFKVFKSKDCGCIELQKDVVVEAETTEVEINLTQDDTKIGGLISKPVTYWYEIELNPETKPQTIIGYDDVEGAKLFVLYPEGSDKE
jgi:hypothetical protein